MKHRALKKRYGRAAGGGGSARFYALIGSPKIVYGPFDDERSAKEVAVTLAMPNEEGCARAMTPAQARALGVPVITRTA